jgi:hypothetical protein
MNRHFEEKGITGQQTKKASYGCLFMPSFSTGIDSGTISFRPAGEVYRKSPNSEDLSLILISAIAGGAGVARQASSFSLLA